MKLAWVISVSMLFVLYAHTGDSESADTNAPQNLKKVEFAVGEKVIPALVYLPDGYASGKKDWPLLIALHGSSQRGSDPEILKTKGLPKFIMDGKKYPFVIVAPQCPSGGYWSTTEQVAQLKTVFDKVIQDYLVDQNRVYLIGYSMGAHGTWAFAQTHPNLFAALVPIAGGGDVEKVAVLAKKPIWVFHGDADEVVPFRQSENTVAALKKAGAAENLKFTVYPGIKHDCWAQTYANEELYTWLLSHKSNPEK